MRIDMKRFSAGLTALIMATSALSYQYFCPVQSVVTAAFHTRISENGISLIKEFEGFIQYAKWDYSQWSIGYGTGVDKDAYPNGITEAEADRLLRDVVVTYEKYVQNFLNKYNITVNQNQYDALVSFTYNLGNVWVSSDTVTIRTYLINGIHNYTDTQIKDAFKLWCKAGGQVLPGLLRRREREADLFLSDSDGVVDSFSGEQWRVTSSTGIRLRKNHDTTSDILTVIPYNAIINISERIDREGFAWGRLSYNGYDGWCVLDYAERIRGNLETTVIPDEEKFEKWRIVSENGVNLRLNYGTSSQALAVVPYNEVITVYEQKDSDGYIWGRTEYNGIDGWCVLNYASKVYTTELKLTGLRIHKLPDKITYTAGELFTSNGMQVVASYSDGTEKLVEDYGCSGNTNLPGVSIITINYQDISIDFSVLVNPQRGDINLNGVIDREDNYNIKKYILNKVKDISFGELGDINGDGKINVFDNVRAKQDILENDNSVLRGIND